ncbi:hypothetical protein ACFQ0G_03280 [Streptomyces chiangmaiensis]
MPAVVAIALEFVGNPELALFFAAFAGFATLLFVEFAGPMRARLSA